jgi:glutaredoxin
MNTPARSSPWRVLWVPVALALLIQWGLQWWQNRQSDETATALASLAQPGDIVMFSTDTCIYCVRARDWMNGHGVRFTECNVDHDSRCLQIYQAQGSPGTPLMRVKDEWQLGFNAQGVLKAVRHRASAQPQ